MNAIQGFGDQMRRLSRVLAGSKDDDALLLRGFMVALFSICYRTDRSIFRATVRRVIQEALEEENRPEIVGLLHSAAMVAGEVPEGLPRGPRGGGTLHTFEVLPGGKGEEE